MHEKQSLTAAASSSSSSSASLFSFVPRSVVLARLSKMTSANGGVSSANGGAAAGKADIKMGLLYSICKYLKSNGFSKAAKKLTSEAKLNEDEVLAANVVDLNEIFSKDFETRTSSLKTAGESDKDMKSNGDTIASKEEDSEIETVTKKKKKVKSGQDASTAKKSDEKLTAEVIPEPDVKAKEKKKSKKATDTAKETAVKADTEIVTEKDKKKKKHKVRDEAPAKESKSTKDSKKRKRDSGEDSDTQVAGPSIDDAATPRKTEEGKVEESAAKKTEDKQGAADISDEAINGNSGDKFSAQKSAKRQKKGSSEPTTAKAFQRVKVEEVVITDERLKDNSYWAKDGAESGYGAKAQEVLGQVRGKDFRHEKTKKKRGSYRGGNIDLHSHSVKFDYSDDE